MIARNVPGIKRLTSRDDGLERMVFETPPANSLRPHTPPVIDEKLWGPEAPATPEAKPLDLGALYRVARKEALELRMAWLAGRAEGKLIDELLYSEMRYAQGRADGLYEALEAERANG